MILPGKELVTVRKFYHGQFPYVLETTGSSAKIIVASQSAKYFFSDGPKYYGKHFQLIKRVKEEAGKYDGPRQIFPWHMVNAEAMEGAAQSLDGYEIDANQAYIRAAQETGILSKKLCRDLQKTEKRYRVRIMGAMATKKTVEEFDAWGKLISRQQVFDAKACAAWSVICHKVSLDLWTVAQSDPGWLAWWVDNYFTTEFSAVKSLRKYYRCKVRRVRIDYNHKGTFVCLNITRDGETKPFNLPTRNQKFS